MRLRVSVSCIRVVLAYHGISMSAEEAARACGTDYQGTVVDLALTGLADAGVEADFRQFKDVTELAEALDADCPVIVILRHPSRSLHAVVVCEVGQEAVTIMDAAEGELVEVALARFERLWRRVQNDGLVIGTRQPRA